MMRVLVLIVAALLAYFLFKMAVRAEVAKVGKRLDDAHEAHRAENEWRAQRAREEEIKQKRDAA